jgi:vacuolar-type H+-ATPase subunit E/Vma4
LLLVIPGLLAYKWYLIRQGRIDPAELKKRKAAKEASKRLLTARNLLDSDGDNKAFYKAISDALEKYIADKFLIQTAELSKDRLRQQLEEKDLDKNDIDKYFEILSNCELALFGGISSKANIELYENANILLQKMLVDLEKTKK